MDDTSQKHVDKRLIVLCGEACRQLVNFYPARLFVRGGMVLLVHIRCGSLPYKRVDNPLHVLRSKAVKWCGENLATPF